MYDVHKTHVCRKLRALCGFRPVEQVKTCRQQQWKKVPDILNRNHQLWFIIPTTTIFLTINTSSSSTSQQQLIIITIIIGCIALVLVSQLSRCPLPDVYGSCTIDASIVELTFIVWPQRCRDATCEATQNNTNRILSIESWLFNRGPYNGYLTIPT